MITIKVLFQEVLKLGVREYETLATIIIKIDRGMQTALMTFDVYRNIWRINRESLSM